MSAYDEWEKEAEDIRELEWDKTEDLFKAYLLLNTQKLIELMHEDMELRREHEKRVEMALSAIANNTKYAVQGS